LISLFEQVYFSIFVTADPDACRFEYYRCST
jgi:hypothetical protein